MKDNTIKRRDFLTKAAKGVLIGTGIMSFLGVITLPLPKIFNEPSSIFKIGFINDFPVNSYFFIAEKNVFILRINKGIKALSAICTHLGCIVTQTDSGFICPCHGSKFDTEGNVLSGAAPKALEWLKVDLSPDGQLIVDANQKVHKDIILEV